MKSYEGQDCSLARALEVIGERWTLLIVRDAFYGVQHFNDFRTHLDIPRAVLSERLAGLVEGGIFERRADPDHAGRHRYEFTQAGLDLWPVVHTMLTWGSEHCAPNRLRFKHAVCETELDDRGYCQTCGLTPAPAEIFTEPVPRRRGNREDPVAQALLTRHPLLQPLDTGAPRGDRGRGTPSGIAASAPAPRR